MPTAFVLSGGASLGAATNTNPNSLTVTDSLGGSVTVAVVASTSYSCA